MRNYSANVVKLCRDNADTQWLYTFKYIYVQKYLYSTVLKLENCAPHNLNFFDLLLFIIFIK